MATFLAGCIVGLGAYAGFVSARESRLSAEKISRRDHDREVLIAQQGRFTGIATQLASDHESVRLAGIYGLSALADEWQEAGHIKLTDTAIELLCSYLRAMRSDGDDSATRAAAVLSIKNHTQKNSEYKWSGKKINLSSADLSNADFDGCNLVGANFKCAILKGAHLARANISNTLLARTDFTWADFYRADLRHARLAGCILRGTIFLDSDLRGAEFNAYVTKVDGEEERFFTDLRGAVMVGANLSGAELRSATIGVRANPPKTIFASRRHPYAYVEATEPEDVATRVIYDEQTSKWPARFDIEKAIKESYTGRYY